VTRENPPVASSAGMDGQGGRSRRGSRGANYKVMNVWLLKVSTGRDSMRDMSRQRHGTWDLQVGNVQERRDRNIHGECEQGEHDRGV
jgi:hypothetical protein